MAHDGWIEFADEELINVSRTAQLAQVLGIDAVWTTPESVQWIQTALAGAGYDDITEAPWFDPGLPASREFAGIIPLSIPGLDDSTASSTTTEFVTDGGATSKPRNATLSVVASVAIVASTDRGADYGKRWLDRRLRGSSRRGRCTGDTLTYFRYSDPDLSTAIVNQGALSSWQERDAKNEVKRIGIVAGTSIDEGVSVPSYYETWPVLAQNILRERLDMGGGVGYVTSSNSSDSGFIPPLPLTVSGGIPFPLKYGLGGRARLVGTANTDHVTYNAQPCTSITVRYSKVQFGGTLKVLIDGVDQGVTLDCFAASAGAEVSGLSWTSDTLTAGSHVVKIIPGSAPFAGLLEGVEFMDRDEEAGYRIYNGGFSGATAATFTTADMERHWESVNALDLDLAIVSLGANDVAYETVATFLANIDIILSRIDPSTPILLVGGYLRGDYNTEAGRAKWDEMQAGLRARAVGRVAYFDLRPHWPALAADGSTSAGLMYDVPPVHPNQSGMIRMAEVMADMLVIEGPPKAHRLRVSLGRAASVTRKRRGACSTVWLVTFTLSVDDAFEYGDPETAVTSLGGVTASGPRVLTSGSEVLTELLCPVFDYTPLYDPMNPALSASPTAPSFNPEGWNISAGMTFERTWAQVEPSEPVALNMVPIITLTSEVDARMVRVAVWPGDADPVEQCEPLFSVIVAYLPAGQEFVIDGQQETAYVWDGSSTAVRRADSLIYGPGAKPVEWVAFNDFEGLLVSLDVFTDSSDYEGDGTVRASLVLVPKSD